MNAHPLAGYRVLVIEDEMLVAMSVEDVLTDAGANVVGPVCTVEAALETLAREDNIDAIVLDMNLNGKSGMPVADAALELSVPVLVLSGYGSSALDGAHTGVPILPKPFEPVTLISYLRQILPPAH